MKKKLYTKQMKMSKAQATSKTNSSQEQKDQNESQDMTSSTPNNLAQQVGSSSGASSHSGTDMQPSCIASSSVPSTVGIVSSLAPTGSSATAVLPSLGRPVPNTAPLPKVDVLMKASLRAFQITDNQNTNYASKTSSPSPQVESLDSDDHVSNQSDIWRKESDVNSNVDLTPLATNHFDMDYARSSGLELRESSTEITKRESRDPSPVYHQMERPVQPLGDPGLYANHPSMATEYADIHHPVNGLHNGQGIPESSEMMRVYDIGPYGHEDANQQDNDHLQTYGPVRAWDQENNRYVDYPWRGEEHGNSMDSVYGKSNSVNDVLNNNVDNRNQRVKKSSGRISGNGKMSGSGMSTRRRRKRVQTPVQRSAANMRERRRMCHLNVAFDHLKDHLPHVKDKKKLSRIQTLKAAIYYIHLLQDSLNTTPRASEL